MPVHVSHAYEARRAFHVLALMGLLLLATLGLAPLFDSAGLEHYLPLHMALETLAIVVAVMAFATAWNSPQAQQPRTLGLLCTLFLGVALLDFSHILSFEGMPDFITPNSPDKGINFWLAARALAAISLLLAAAGVGLRSGRGGRCLALTFVLALVAGLHVLFLAYPQYLPRTFIAGQGLTPFKLMFEYGLILVYLLAAVGFWWQLKRPRTYNVGGLMAVAGLMAMGEFYFTLYADVQDVYNLLGHVYKVMAYGFLYQAVVVAAVKAPYEQLQASKQQLRATLDALPDLLFELDEDGRYRAVHSASNHEITAPTERLLGNSLEQVMPAEQAKICRQTLTEAREKGVSRGHRVQLQVPQGQRWFELSVAYRTSDGRNDSAFLMLSRDVTQLVEHEQKLEEQRRVLATFFNTNLDLFCIVDLQGQFVTLNPEWEEVLGYPKGELEGSSYMELVHPDDREPTRREQLRLNDEDEMRRFENRFRHRDGSYRVIEWRSVRQDGLIYASARNITGLREQQEKMRKLSQAVEQSPFPIVITDRFANIEYVNQAFVISTGYRREEVTGRNSRMFQSGKTPKTTYQSMWETLLNDKPWEGEVINRRKDGREYTERTLIYPIHNEQGQVTHYLAHKEDVTEQQAAARRIEQLSRYDSLTGLGNLSMAYESLQQGLTQTNNLLAVIWLDLDRFKDINDIFGHEQGDSLLQELAGRFRQLLKSGDALCRHSGDTFIFVLRKVDEARAGVMASRILDLVIQPLLLLDKSLSITGSAGIALSPGDGDTPEALLTRAEAAMYQSKQQGQHDYRFFTADLQQQSVRLLELRLALQQAVERNELRLVYQPQIDLQTGSLSGVEVLVRWVHPEYGFVSPAEFIPIAEESGLIVSIGEWIAKTALRQYRDWQRAGLPSFTLALNLSAVQFALPSLVEDVCRWVEEVGVSPRQVELEMTEAAAMANPEVAAATIRALSAKGFLLAIDDFGTGYSSLSYLKRFAIQRLKIDQSFVRDIDTNPSDRAIVSAIIQMARSLGLSTIAEGVETPAQQQLLQAEGCQQVQGYLYSRPLPAAELEAFVRSMPALGGSTSIV